jgi:hypothetical protein
VSFRHVVLVALLPLSACHDNPIPAARVRDLTTALTPPPVDTAKQRADSQFATCLYVYNSEEKLRECLVLRNGWKAQDAERQIVLWKRERAKYYAALVRRDDSLRRAKALTADSVRRMERLQLQARAARERATYPIWGDTDTKLFYRNQPGCQTLLRAQGAVKLFRSEDDVRSAGFMRGQADSNCEVPKAEG